MPTVNKADMECTVRGCSCDCFCPGKTRLRTCDGCEHSWVVHAMDKVSYRTPAHHLHSGQSPVVEVVQPSVVFDIASLMLYGSQATPIRIKILMDRLFSVVQHDDIVRVLHSFGWSYEDYCRGYILQESSSGRVLNKWSIVSPEEELIILQQFLRFGETQVIAQELIDRCGWEEEQVCHQDNEAPLHCLPGAGSPQSSIKKFIERDSFGTQGPVKGYDAMHQLLSRNFLYPHLASAGFARLLALQHGLQTQGIATSNLLRNKRGLSSKPENHQNQAMATKAAVSSRSPLQCIQPFDYRKVSSSVSSPKTTCCPTATASFMDGGLSTREGRAFAELGLSAGQGSGIPPRPMKVKAEIPEENNSTTRRTADDRTQQTMTADEGAIDYSVKARRTAAGATGGLVRPTTTSSLAGPQATVSVAANAGSSIFAHQKLKQLRKSSNPMKRRPWQPTPGYGGTLISPAGKKRVLCTACQKTFCDKGALKIHYSAVHLREMHRCTVDGCAMMFSSRRSRNRHSANPNPKLHLPHTGRRKFPVILTVSNQTDEEDDDDEEEEEEEATVTPSLSCSSAAPDYGGSGDLVGTKGLARRSLNPDVLDASLSSGSSDILVVEQVAAFPLRVVPRFFLGTGEAPAADACHLGRSGRSVDADRQSPEEEEEEEEDAKKVSDGEAKDKADASAAGDSIQSRSSGSKRKSAMPTRCSLQTNTADSDDDDDESPGDSSKRPRRTCSNHLPVTSESFYSAATATDQRDAALKERDYVTATEVDDSGSSSPTSASSSSSSSHSSSSNETMRSEVVYSDGNQRFDNFRRQSDTQGNHVTYDGRTNKGPKTSTASDILRCVNAFASHPSDASSLSLDTQKKYYCVSESEILSTSPTCVENSTEKVQIGSGETKTDRETCDRTRESSDVTDMTSRGNGFFRDHLEGASLLDGPGPPSLVRPSHRCAVAGCNAAFHSKRSRDRHSANRSLHRRLLSTTPPPPPPPPPPHMPPSCHEESTKMRHDGQEGCCFGSTVTTTPGFEGHRDAYEIEKEDFCNVLNLSKNAHATASLQSGSSSDPNEGGRGLEEGFIGFPDHDTSSGGSPVPASTSPPARGTPVDRQTDSGDDSPAVESFDAGGCAVVVVCHLCQRPFKDNLALKEHREDVHPTEMFRCTVSGCDKVFSTRKSRNRHSQNDNLHKHLPIAS